MIFQLLIFTKGFFQLSTS